MKVGETMLFYDTQKEKPIIAGYGNEDIHKGRHVFIDKSIHIPEDACELTFVKNVFFVDEDDRDENGNVKEELIDKVEERRYLLKFQYDTPIFPEVLFNSVLEHDGDFNCNEWCLAKITIAPCNYGKCYFRACFGATLLKFVDMQRYDDDDVQIKIKQMMPEKGDSNVG